MKFDEIFEKSVLGFYVSYIGGRRLPLRTILVLGETNHLVSKIGLARYSIYSTKIDIKI